jgi:hypothetical protein
MVKPTSPLHLVRVTPYIHAHTHIHIHMYSAIWLKKVREHGQTDISIAPGACDAMTKSSTRWFSNVKFENERQPDLVPGMYVCMVCMYVCMYVNLRVGGSLSVCQFESERQPDLVPGMCMYICMHTHVGLAM